MIGRLLGIVIILSLVFMGIWLFVHIMNRWRRREDIKEEEIKHKGGTEK